jgi:hypothetical protein
MSTFLEDTMSALSHDVVIASCGNDMSSHWGGASPMLSGVAFEAALGPDHAYAKSAFLSIPPAKLGSSTGANAWPWSDPTEVYSSAPLEYGLGSARPVPALAAIAALPAIRAYPIGGTADVVRIPGGVFPERDLDPAYGNHIH